MTRPDVHHNVCTVVSNAMCMRACIRRVLCYCLHKSTNVTAKGQLQTETQQTTSTYSACQINVCSSYVFDQCSGYAQCLNRALNSVRVSFDCPRNLLHLLLCFSGVCCRVSHTQSHALLLWTCCCVSAFMLHVCSQLKVIVCSVQICALHSRQ
jgi:hypothetical protein